MVFVPQRSNDFLGIVFGVVILRVQEGSIV